MNCAMPKLNLCHNSNRFGIGSGALFLYLQVCYKLDISTLASVYNQQIRDATSDEQKIGFRIES